MSDVGFYPMSIGTSLAIEGLNGTGEREDTNKGFDTKRFGALYVNLRLLVRNAIASFPYAEQNSLANAEIIPLVERDFEGITKYAPEELEVVPYICTHESLNKEFSGKFKQYETERQKLAIAIEEGAIKKLEEKYRDTLTRFDIELKGEKRTICLTHHPIDLLSVKRFPELVLLESHTGKLKPAKEWSTKLRTLEEHGVVPFNKVTLQLYGDNNMFMPQPKKLRDVLLKIGQRKRWNPTTSQASMVLDVRNSYEPQLYKILKTLE